MNIEIYQQFDCDLEKKWKNFENNAELSAFQSFIWISNWYSIVGKPLYFFKPQIVLVENNRSIIGIFPFGIRKVFGINLLEWLGGVESDYMGPLLHKNWNKLVEDFNSLWNEIINNLPKFDLLYFQKQQKVGTLNNPIITNLKSNEYIKSYQVSLHETWESHYKKTVKSKIRSDSKRQRRRLSEFGKNKFLFAKNNEQKLKVIEKMIYQKSSRYRETSVWDMFSIHEHKNFYKTLAYINDEKLKPHCSALMVDEKIIAAHVGIVFRDTFYYLMPSYDRESWGDFSPGRLLLENLIEWSIENEIKVFDFTNGEEKYKKYWCDIETPIFYTIKSYSFLGYIFSFFLNKKHLVKKSQRITKIIKFTKYFLRNFSKNKQSF